VNGAVDVTVEFADATPDEQATALATLNQWLLNALGAGRAPRADRALGPSIWHIVKAAIGKPPTFVVLVGSDEIIVYDGEQHTSYSSEITRAMGIGSPAFCGGRP